MWVVAVRPPTTKLGEPCILDGAPGRVATLGGHRKGWVLQLFPRPRAGIRLGTRKHDKRAGADAPTFVIATMMMMMMMTIAHRG